MTEAFQKQIEQEARQAVTELLAEAKLKKGDVFVVGCSSSEIVGGHIGKDSSLEAARAVYAGIAPVLAENGIWLAAQCCEHRQRQLEADVYRRQQLHGGVPGGQQSVFWRGGQRTGAVGTHLKTEVF